MYKAQTDIPYIKQIDSVYKTLQFPRGRGLRD